MNKKLVFSIMLLTIVACIVFVVSNPNIATDYPAEFSDGEVFMPENGSYDFRAFSINSSSAKNFTARTVGNGHVQFIDNTGNITINFFELDKMINFKKDRINSFLDGELKKPSWSVDGVSVHQIDFKSGEPLYSAYYKNSSENMILYLSTPSEQETADIMNSLEFKGE